MMWAGAHSCGGSKPNVVSYRIGADGNGLSFTKAAVRTLNIKNTNNINTSKQECRTFT